METEASRLRVRPAAVAGLFYPADPAALRQAVERELAAAHPAGAVSPKVIIVPHAGYIYSGPVAATAYAALAPGRDRIGRVVLLGPSHHVGFRGLAVPQADAFETPLGRIMVDRPSCTALSSLPEVRCSDRPHQDEHSLEVQLPFLQVVLGDFRLVPIVCGDAAPEAVAAVMRQAWGGDETLIVVSSDLSHYHDYSAARQLDTRTGRRIVALDATLAGTEACGCVPVNGLLHLARALRLRPSQLDLRNSGDTAGDRARVVGYGAFAFHDADTASA